MVPIHELHSTRGSFGAEARERAVIVPGPFARIAPVVLCGAALLMLGAIGRRKANVKGMRLRRR